LIGSTLSHYRITAKLGEGGMGVVWRAEDSQLDREVALKILPEGLVADSDRLARFEREAKLLAQLNHPHIAQIYGLEVSGPTRALVMELVEGPTLAERLEAGPMPLDEGLAMARHLAGALEAAHDKGIVHRDLKPQNVKVAEDGQVKVLDFGLAKALEPESSSSTMSPLTHSPTISFGATVEGVILGTAAYMAPEQAAGKAVDRRADIWAFGVLVYEALTGGQMFAADSVPETLAAVLRGEIDLARLPEGTPAAVRRLLRRCLERNPKNRLHDIADARIVLDEVLSGGVEEELPTVEEAPPPVAGWRRLLPWVAALLAVGVVLAAFVAGQATRPSAASLQVEIGAPEGERFHFQGDYGAPAVFSPDGSEVAFGAVGADARTRLWVRNLATGAARRLEGTEGATAPFFSPDGRSLGYFAENKVWTIAVSGGAPLGVADAGGGRGGAWAPGGTIVFSPEFRSPLFRVPAAGGKPEQLTRIDATRHSSHRWPVITPDGRAVVYLATSHDSAHRDEVELRWVRLDGTGDHALVHTLGNGAVSDGTLFYLRDQTLVARPLSASGELGGAPVVVAQDVLYDLSTWRGTFSVSGDRLLYAPGGKATGSILSLVDRSGRLLQELAPDGRYWDLALSPDGKRLAVARGVPSDLWMLDLERGTSSRFTFEANDELSPCWSADGQWVYYLATGPADSRDRIYRKAASGGGASELVYESDAETDLQPTDVSPDGRWLITLAGTFPFDTQSGIALLPLDGSKKLIPWMEGPAVKGAPHFSPDGRWVAYASDESGFTQVYVTAASAGGDGETAARWQVSVDGGDLPLWSRDGSEIVYLEPSLNLSRVTVAPDGAGGLRFGTPEPLFATTLLADQQSFDLAPDGQSLVLNHFGESQSRPLELVLGWRQRLGSR
jgi:Tol biopolymer transport system component